MLSRTFHEGFAKIPDWDYDHFCNLDSDSNLPSYHEVFHVKRYHICKQPEESTSVALTKGMEMMIAGFIPNTRYFDSRFDLLQVQVDLLQKGQSEVKSQIIRLEDQVERRFERSDEILKGFKSDVDKRFEQSDEILKGFKSDIDKRLEQVDKRFQQVDDKLDKILERIDRRIDEGLRENRVQSMRMFIFAMTFSAISMIGLVGKMMKLF